MIKYIDELPLAEDPIHQQSSDWERLDVHARRVRILYMEPSNVKISSSIYFRIGAMRDSPLLPGLAQIYIPKNYSLDLSSALFLASGSPFLNLVHLDGNAIADRQFFVPFLSSLYLRSPGLTHLALRGVINTSLEPVYRFTKLQSLEIRLFNPHLHPQLLQKLGQLRHLHDLIIDTGTIRGAATSTQPYMNPTFISDSKFTQLIRLQILGTATSISCILSGMGGLANLTTLKIDEVWDGWSSSSIDSSWRSSFEIISTFSAIEDIEITHAPNRPRGQYVLLVSSLVPLFGVFRLNNVKSFVINFDNAVCAGSDEDFRQLAVALPKLKKFVVPTPISYLGTNVTLGCLYHFSRECPDLRDIRINLSLNISDNLNAIKKLPHPIVRNYRHPLEKLYVESDFGQLQPTHLVQVARFLDLIFPNLSTLETDNTKTTEVANWAGIHELRLALRDARIINPSGDI